MSLLGSSGSGKTTCLRLINGLLRPDRGRVFLDGQLVRPGHSTALRRKMGYSLQGRSLFPHWNVGDNISVLARRQKWASDKIKARVTEVLQMVQLTPSDALKKPHELSGGQQQRVGIARALFMSPRIMLMDEPFGALDPVTRAQLQDLFLDLKKHMKLTVVLVTHDTHEALKMSDRIALLNKGLVEQIGPPNLFLNSPRSEYVKQFFQTYQTSMS